MTWCVFQPHKLKVEIAFLPYCDLLWQAMSDCSQNYISSGSFFAWRFTASGGGAPTYPGSEGVLLSVEYVNTHKVCLLNVMAPSESECQCMTIIVPITNGFLIRRGG